MKKVAHPHSLIKHIGWANVHVYLINAHIRDYFYRLFEI